MSWFIFLVTLIPPERMTVMGTFYDKARKFAKVHFIKIQKEGMGSALMKNWERVPEVQ